MTIFAIDHVFDAFESFESGSLTLEQLRSDVFTIIVHKEHDRIEQELSSEWALADFGQEQ